MKVIRWMLVPITGFLMWFGGVILYLAWKLDPNRTRYFCEWLELYGYYCPSEEIEERKPE